MSIKSANSVQRAVQKSGYSRRIKSEKLQIARQWNGKIVKSLYNGLNKIQYSKQRKPLDLVGQGLVHGVALHRVLVVSSSGEPMRHTSKEVDLESYLGLD